MKRSPGFLLSVQLLKPSLRSRSISVDLAGTPGQPPIGQTTACIRDAAPPSQKLVHRQRPRRRPGPAERRSGTGEPDSDSRRPRSAIQGEMRQATQRALAPTHIPAPRPRRRTRSRPVGLRRPGSPRASARIWRNAGGVKGGPPARPAHERCQHKRTTRVEIGSAPAARQ